MCQVYNSDLDEVGLIFIPNDNQDDCNFLAVDPSNRLVVSCESEVRHALVSLNDL